MPTNSRKYIADYVNNWRAIQMDKFICTECGITFDEPKTITEKHGLETPPYEEIDVCPECGGSFKPNEEDIQAIIAEIASNDIFAQFEKKIKEKNHGA
jgi:NAD-dependent SIR2 family protein deacetylase